MHLKLETFQPTGSFKVRGGLAALDRAGGGPVIMASAGNAGLGLAWAAAALGVHATVVVAETASPAKVAALEALPVALVRHGAGYDEAEAHALELAARGATYLSSYNDAGLIAGLASLGRELDEQLPGPLRVACPSAAAASPPGWGCGPPAARTPASWGSRRSARRRCRPRWRPARSRRSRSATRSPTASRATSSAAR